MKKSFYWRHEILTLYVCIGLLHTVDCWFKQEVDEAALLAQLKGGAKAVATAQSTTGTGNTKTGKVMSMSTSLGSKTVPFGHSAAGGKKGKKTNKKKTKKSKAKAKNYDDDGVGLLWYLA